ncbi:MAG: PAS domain S-box protein, partial [Pseudomonadota bacterium]
ERRAVVRNEKKIQEIIYLAQDITDRKRQEDALTLSAKVFEHTAEGILITDSKGIILSANTAFTVMTGYTAEEVAGKSLEILGSEIQDNQFYTRMMRTLEASGSWEGEIWRRRKDGKVHPQWLTISSILDDDGNVTHYAGIFMDLSEIKQAEERIYELATTII